MGARQYRESTISPSRSRAVAALVATIILAGGCGHSDPVQTGDISPSPSLSFDTGPADVVPTTAARAGGLSQEPSTARLTEAERPPLELPILVATAVGSDIWSYPHPAAATPDQWFPNPTQFGGPRVFRVVDADSDPEFVQVSLPSMPNGQIGWVKRNEVELSVIDHQVLVDLGERTVTVWHNDEIISDTRAVTGAPATPTPLGVFFVRDIIERADAGGAYGPYILALSGFSETLTSFNGGLPAIAIHGTNNPGLMGEERSNGCVRVPNDIIEYLARKVPLGTPVTIVA